MSRHAPPTARQQRYLRQLALERGQTFTSPTTRAQASAEIERLLGQQRSSRVDASLDVRSVRDGVHSGSPDAAGVRDDELDGYGATAVWKGSRP